MSHKDPAASDALKDDAAGNAQVRAHAIEASTGAIGVAPAFVDSLNAAIAGQSDLVEEERQAGKDIVSDGD